MPRKLKKSNSKLYSIFIGSFVNIAMKDLVSKNKDSRFGNLVIGGVLLDECDDYLYIGNGAEITGAIPKQQVIGLFTESSGIPDGDEVPPGTVRQ